MSITVVTVRDESGAPSAREVYASGDRYTIGNGNLEILSSKPQLLALYPSGNWLSAYVDDCVQVVSGVASGTQQDATGVSSVGSPDHDATLGSDADAGAGLDVDPAELGPAADAGTDGVTYLAESDIDLAESDAESDIDRNALSAANAPGDEASGSEPDEPEAATLPPGMLRVAFRSITVKGPRGAQPEAPDRSRLRPVAFAPRILRAVRSEDETPAEPRSTRLRPVVFAPRTYRAARTQPGPHAPDDAPPQGDELNGDPETSAQ